LGKAVVHAFGEAYKQTSLFELFRLGKSFPRRNNSKRLVCLYAAATYLKCSCELGALTMAL